MAEGPGKYDVLCTLVRDLSEARAALVIVLDGNKGSGFSVQVTDPFIFAGLADLLEETARQIRKDQAAPS